MRSGLLLVVLGACTIYDDGDPPNVTPPDPPEPPAAALSHTLFMSFEGATVSPGAADDATANRSIIVQADVTVEPFLAGDPDRAAKIDAVVTEVKAILAPFDIQITTTRPASGSYHMLVYTSSPGSALGPGLHDVQRIVPLSCNTTPAAIGFELEVGERNSHVLAQSAIATLGVWSGIPSSAVASDCMCFDGPACLPGHSTGACVIGGPDTPILDAKTCIGGGGTMDERERFVTQFGAAP